MTVPKWLLPVVSIIAAIAVAVSMGFVGASFASKKVIEKAVGTETAQVVQPVATGLTNADAAALARSGNLGGSPTTGTVQVSKPGAKSVNPPLNREVDLIASGRGSGDAPSTASHPTPSPTTPPDSSTVGVSAYVPGPSLPAASDPCAASGSVPASCPDGLHSVVLALTAPPAPEFTAVPYAYPCAARFVPNTFAGHGSVDVTLTSTVPMSWSIHYQSSPPPASAISTVPHGIVTFTTPAVEINAWNDARSRDVAAATLPKLYTCATIPSVWNNGALAVDITGTATDGTSIVHHLTFNPSGPGAAGPLRVQPYGSDAFVAYAESPTNQTIHIQAYTAATDATPVHCDHVDNLTPLASVYSRTDTIGAIDVTELNLPADYTKRTAVGFRVATGSIILVCATWFRGAGAASFDRQFSLRSSQIVADSPAISSRLEVNGMEHHNLPFGQIRSDIARVRVFGTFDDGTPCEHEYNWTKGDPPPGDLEGDLICTARPNETLDAATGGFSQTMQDAHINVTVQVIGTSGRRAHQVFRIDLTEPICIGCSSGTIQDASFHLYQLRLPDPYSNPLDNPGDLYLYADWYDRNWYAAGTHAGSSPVWIVGTPEEGGPDTFPLAADSPPRFNTDNRMTVDTSRTTLTEVTGELNYEADRDGAYRLTLKSATGGAPCTTNGATSVVVGGEYPTARVTVPILIPHLCHGAVYVATLETIQGTNYVDTSAEGSLTYGYPYGGWSGYVLFTPAVTVHVQYTETVTVAPGTAMTDLDLHLGVADVHPLTDLSGGCASQTFTHTGTSTLTLGSQVQLHLHYRVRHITSAAGRACTFPAADVAPAIDAYRTIDLNAVMANPDGVLVTSGPYSVVLKFTPAS